MDAFTRLKHVLLSLLEEDRYTIYQIDDEGFRKQPWMDSCALLLFAMNDGKTEHVDEIRLKLNTFINKGNRKVLCYDVNEKFQNKLWCQKFSFKGRVVFLES